MTTATASKRIAPERLAKIVRLVTAIDAMRGRTVPALMSGVPSYPSHEQNDVTDVTVWDGRAIVEQDADGFAVGTRKP